MFTLAPSPDGASARVMTPQPVLSAASLARLRTDEIASLCGGPTALEQLIHAAQSGIETSAHPSRLTACGAPIEAAFVWPANELRLSIDPCPAHSAAERSARCITALTAALSPLQTQLLEQSLLWQQTRTCRFGAWLGLRMVGGALHHKLYLEIPLEAHWQSWEQGVLDAAAVLPDRRLRLSMLGLDPHSGKIELYYRCEPLFASELNTLMRRVNLPERAPEVSAWIRTLIQRTARFELPSHDMGFSYALDASAKAQAFTWYSTAEALLGPPAHARAALLRGSGPVACTALRGYGQFSDSIAQTPEHGLVGAVLAADVPMQMTATVSAYGACAQALKGASHV